MKDAQGIIRYLVTGVLLVTAGMTFGDDGASGRYTSPAGNTSTVHNAAAGDPLPGDAPPDDALPGDPPQVTNVLIIGIDTLRGDHMHCAGMEWIQTPAMDALVADGVYFSRCYATAPWTLPSFASIFTGLLPYRHGAIGGDHPGLDDRFTTMAELFAAAGYLTTGYVSIDYLTDSFGMAQGYNASAPELPAQEMDQASLLTWLARNLFSERRGEATFLFLHYFDVHTPYTPPAPFDRMYYDGDERAPGEPIMTLLRSERNRAARKTSQMYDFLAGVTDLQFPVKQYAAGVTYVDDHVGQVIRKLQELGLYERMLIVLVSDHGEHLGEHDVYFAHTLPYQETLHVPMIIKLPGTAHAGMVVHEPVSTLDILPTVLEVAGLPATGPLDGRSLSNLIFSHGGADGPSTAIDSLTATSSFTAAEQGSAIDHFVKALIEEPWKLLWFHDSGRDRYELYDLARDPGEQHDLAQSFPELVARMQARMWELFDPQLPLGLHPETDSSDLDEETKRRLRALGY